MFTKSCNIIWLNLTLILPKIVTIQSILLVFGNEYDHFTKFEISGLIKNKNILRTTLSFITGKYYEKISEKLLVDVRTFDRLSTIIHHYHLTLMR